MSHYIISVGHTASGNIGCGAVDKIDESNCTREIAPIVAQLLRDNGHAVTFLQVDRSNTYNCEDCYVRAQQANAVGGDLFVEIHINAGGGTGSEVIVNSEYASAKDVAARVTAAISTSMGFPNRGVKAKSLIVLNRTSMPAILVECLFCDSSDAYRYDANKLASAIVTGLLNTQVTAPDKYKKGWIEDSNGWWYCTDAKAGYYYTADNGWQNIDGEWYIFDTRGYALQNKWYHDSSDNNWYYLNKACMMQRNSWILWYDLWYYVGEHGQMLVDQFFKDGNGKSYYLDEDGAMLIGCVIQGKQLGPDGSVVETKIIKK